MRFGERSRYRDRHHAGQVLADALMERPPLAPCLVLALPRGGLPVAAPIAHRLRAPLDVFIVRKLGCPGHEELALGAIASGGILVRDERLMSSLGIASEALEPVSRREQEELRRREHQYRGTAPAPDPEGKTVILVDDGLATGASMRAAVLGLRSRRPARLIIAVPVGSPEVCHALAQEADDLVCPLQPEDFRSVGEWYEDFAQLDDEAVRGFLARGAREDATA